MTIGFRERFDPYRLYLFGMALPVSFLGSFAGTTAIVYYVSSGHLNPLQLVTLGTAVPRRCPGRTAGPAPRRPLSGPSSIAPDVRAVLQLAET